MEKFWGRTGGGNSQGTRFSRDDEQLLALNYENLCDADYVSRLFQTQTNNGSSPDAVVDRSDSSGSVLLVPGLSLTPADELLTAGNMVEDVAIFGDESVQFTQECLVKRICREMDTTTMKIFDPNTSLIYRQVDVFEYIGRVVIDRCQRTLTNTSAAAESSASSRNNDDDDDNKNLSEVDIQNYAVTETAEECNPHLSFLQISQRAVLSSIKIFEKQSRLSVKRQTLEPVLGFVFNMYSSKTKMLTCKENIASYSTYLHHLRQILCNGIVEGLKQVNPLEVNKLTPPKLEETVNLVLSCVYGLLVLGFYTEYPGDVCIALMQLVTVQMQFRDFKDGLHRMASEIATNRASLSSLRPATSSVFGNSSDRGLMPVPSVNHQTVPNNDSQKVSSLVIKGKFKSKPDMVDPSSKILKTSAMLSTHGPQQQPQQVPNDESAREFSQIDFSKIGQGSGGKGWEKLGANNGVVGRLPVEKEIAKGKGALLKANIKPVIDVSVIDPEIAAGHSNNLTVMSVLTSTPKAHRSKIVGSNNNNNNGNNQLSSPTAVTVMSGVKEKAKLQAHKNPTKGASTAIHSLPQSSVIPESVGISNNKNNNYQYNNNNISSNNNNNNNENCVAENTPDLSRPLLEDSLVEQLMLVMNNSFSIPKSVLKLMSDSHLVSLLFTVGTGSEKFTSDNNNKSIVSRGVISSSSANIPDGRALSSYVWSCGQNSYGELGHNDVITRKSYTKIAFLDAKSIIDIGAGNEHSVFLTDEGKLLVSGYNDNGQCGTGTNQQVKSPMQLQGILDAEEIAQIHAYNGCEHTLAITKDGKLYSFGYNYRGQLGLGGTNSESVPRPVKALLSRKIISASCSYHHSYFLCLDGAIFSCGRNDCGQLGHGDTVDKKTPQMIIAGPRNINSISCGQFHSVMLSDEGHVFVCGKNDYGQLGLEVVDSVKTITRLPLSLLSESESIAQICCGYYHTMLLSSSAVVLGFGRNDYGQLGLGHVQTKVHTCSIVSAIRDKNVINVTAGCYHTIATTANGMLYVFGRNNHGQLGTGDLDERHSPHPVDDFVGKQVIKVAAGFYHTLVLIANEGADCNGLPVTLKASGDSILKISPTVVANHSSYSLPVITSQQDSLLATNNLVSEHLKALHDISLKRQKAINLPDGKVVATPLKPSRRKFTIEHRSKCTVPDLITFLVHNMDVLLQLSHQGSLRHSSALPNTAGAAASSHSFWNDVILHEDSRLEKLWAVKTLKALTLLMEFCRSILSDGLSSESPISADDACRLLAHSIRAAEQLLIEHSLIFLSAKLECPSDVSTLFPVGELLSKPQPKIIAAIDLILEFSQCFNRDKFMAETSSVDKAVIESLVKTGICRLRQELFLAHFHLSTEQCDSKLAAEVTDRAEGAIKRCYETLFQDVADCSELFRLLGYYLVHSVHSKLGDELQDAITSFEVDPDVDYSRCLKLFCRLCFKFRGVNDVIRVFQQSHYYALLLFQQVLLVYNHLSMVSIESKASGAAGGLSSPLFYGVAVNEMSRCLGTLEHTTSNFIKVAVPIMMNAKHSIDHVASSTTDHLVYDLSYRIISDILLAATQVVNFLRSQTMNDDVASLLRNSTVLPTILPTVLLYGIAKSNSTTCINDMVPQLQQLMRWLQGIGRIYGALNDGDSPMKIMMSTVPRLQSVDPSSIASTSLTSDRGSFDNFGFVQTTPSVLQGHTFGLAMSPQAVSPVPVLMSSLAVTKKDAIANSGQPFPLWTRLLKLTTILTSKIAMQLVGNEMSAAKNSPLITSSVWRYLSLPENFILASAVLKDFSAVVQSQIDDHGVLTLPSLNLLRNETLQKDSTYRNISLAASRNPLSKDLIGRLESILFDCVYRMNVPESSRAPASKQINFLRLGWQEIVAFIKNLFSKRSLILASALHHEEPHGWIEVLERVVDFCSAIKRFSMVCPFRFASFSPLLLPRSTSQMQSACGRWRKILLIVMCLNRWKNSTKSSFSQAGSAVVKYAIAGLEFVTSGYQKFYSSNMKANWTQFIELHSAGLIASNKFIAGMLLFENLIGDSFYVSMKTDMMLLLLQTWSQRVTLLQDLELRSSNDYCCSLKLQQDRHHVLKSLVDSAVSILKDFMTAITVHSIASLGISELNLLTLVIKFLHVFYLSVDGLSYQPIRFMDLHRLLYALDEKSAADIQSVPANSHLTGELLTGKWFGYVSCVGSAFSRASNVSPGLQSNFNLSMGVEEKGLLDGKDKAVSTTGKKLNARDRSKALRKVSNAVVSFIQHLSVSSMHSNIAAAGLSPWAKLDANLSLCAYLQVARLINTFNHMIENADVVATTKDVGQVPLTGYGSSITATALLASAAAAVMSGVGHANNIMKAAGTSIKDISSSNFNTTNINNAHKRRCQDLITKPMEFSRSHEGFVVQGDKLINNVKGVEFTLTMWILISNKNGGNATSFITGKVSHNDAWPIVIMRLDGKLEIIYGHSNDFERFASQAVIPNAVWTHVAIVIEQKKIKLFINGVQDSQVSSSKGNGRAVLYPLLVGSCPTGIRTRVEFVKKGFDGMLSQYKYYTRALSPIHIKVIFDQGLPESYDIREKWLYNLISTVKLERRVFDRSLEVPHDEGALSKISHHAVDSLLLVFVTEQGSRLRCAALQALEHFLSIDVVHEAHLPSNTGCSTVKYRNLVAVSKCVFLCEFSTFHERMLLYFIRILGSCWSPLVNITSNDLHDTNASSTFAAELLQSANIRNTHANIGIPVTESDAELSRFREFLVYAPSFLADNNLSDANQAASSSANDQAAPMNIDNVANASNDGDKAELCAHMIKMLASLSSAPRWKDALSSVIRRVLSKNRVINEAKGEWMLLPKLDILGIAALLGDQSLGHSIHLGADVLSSYSDSVCRVLSMNHSTNAVTVIGNSSDASRRVVFVTQLKDLVATKYPANRRVVTGAVHETVIMETLHLLNTYKDFVKYILHDGLASSSAVSSESHFPMFMLKYARPFESFVYFNLLSFITQVLTQSATERDGLTIDLVKLFRGHISFLQMLQMTAIRLVKMTSAPVNIPFSTSNSNNNSNVDDAVIISTTSHSSYHENYVRPKPIGTLWRLCNRYLSIVPDKVVVSEFSDFAADHSWYLSLIDHQLLLRKSSVIELQKPLLQDNLLKQGCITEWFVYAAVNQDILSFLDGSAAHSKPISFFAVPHFDDKYLVGEWKHQANSNNSNNNNSSNSTNNNNNNSTDNSCLPSNSESSSSPNSLLGHSELSALSPQDIFHASRFLIELRNSIIIASRVLLQQIPLLDILSISEIPVASIPRYLLLWESIYCIPDSCTQNCRFPYISMMNGANLSLQNRSVYSSPDSDLFSSTSMEIKRTWGTYNKLLAGLRGSTEDQVSKLLLLHLQFFAFSFLQPSAYKNDQNILIESDIFHRTYRAMEGWLLSQIDTDKECDICLELLKLVTAMLPIADGSEVHIMIMQLCQYAARRLYHRSLCRTLTDAAKVVAYSRNDSFMLLRSYAQEKLQQEKGRAHASYSSLTYQLVNLSLNLELLQRTISWSPTIQLASMDNEKPIVGSIEVFSLDMLTTPIKCSDDVLNHIVTGVPVLTDVMSNTAEIDLRESANLVLGNIYRFDLAESVIAYCNKSNLAANNALLNSSLEFGVSQLSLEAQSPSKAVRREDLSDFVIMEIAIAASVNGEFGFYETVYFGGSLRVVQSDLIPGCSYMVKARAVVGGLACAWSEPVQFTTSSGIIFAFDSLRSGPDILLSNNGLTASYGGDDSWSTILANHSFSSGVTSWEICVKQSSTAYVFVGVATGSADLNTFLGGCPHGWGFIGEQALYHNREKVKLYGDAFSAGDVVGVTIDFNQGTLSFSRNGKSLGVAFDKIFGELYPAVAFYNVGQELEIVPESFTTTCPHQVIPCSPACTNFDEISLLKEISFCMQSSSPLSNRLLELVASSLNEWCAGASIRSKTYSGKYIFLNVQSSLLQKYNLIIGEKVRTPYGIAEVAGVAYDRIWFRFNHVDGIWYFSQQQVLNGRERGYFIRCTYYAAVTGITSTKALFNSETLAGIGGIAAISEVGTKGALNANAIGTTTSNASSMTFDVAALQELFDPKKWSDEMDSMIVAYLLKQAEKLNISPWSLTCDQIYDDFRTMQQQLSRIVRGSSELTHKWGIAGPKRKAVIARIGMLRMFNHILEQYLPVILEDGFHNMIPNTAPICSGNVPTPEANNGENQKSSDGNSSKSDSTSDVNELCASSYGWHNSFGGKKSTEEANPIILSVISQYPPLAISEERHLKAADVFVSERLLLRISTTWMQIDRRVMVTGSSLLAIRNRVFTDLKMTHFWEVLRQSNARVAKTEDDYDYPEDLPQVKINRLKSFRIREASELLQIPGEDLYLSSMFCQLWRELRQHSSEKLRISYTHPMDDGQSRAFKIKFDGEGVDDYGGPYREILQQLCDELQSPDPSLSGIANQPLRRFSELAEVSQEPLSATAENDHSISRPSTRCFIPLLFPTPNWTASECAEKYRYMFHPASLSPVRLNLYNFLGQVVGIAIRSKITLDLALPSMIWKCVVQEPLSERDIASFDAPAAEFISHLSNLGRRFESQAEDKDAMEALVQEADMLMQDLYWTCTRSDGKLVELIPGGSKIQVDLINLKDFLQTYVECRLSECQLAIETFRQGLLSVIPETALSLLTGAELESIVGGSRTIDVLRLQQNTEYDDDVSPEDEHIMFFWDVLNEFSEDEKTAFLRFVWARPTLPPKGVDFSQKFKVQSAVGDDAHLKPDQYLPKAHTCFFSVNLPRYSSKAVMAEKLRYAIANCTEMDADFRVTETDVAGWGGTLSTSQLSSSFRAEEN